MSTQSGEVQRDQREGLAQLVDVLSDATRPSRWSHLRLFVAPAGAPRARRPSDAMAMILSTIVIVSLLPHAGDEPDGFMAALIDFVTALPDLLDPIWQFAADLGRVWCAFLILAALWRRHWDLFRDIAIAAIALIGLASVITWAVTGDWPDVLATLAGAHDGLEPFPALGIALQMMLISVAATHLSRPFRYLGRWILTFSILGNLVLVVSSPTGLLGGIALGLGVAATVHLVFGSPGGRPTHAEIAAGLHDLRLDAEPRGEVDMLDGVCIATGQDRSGRGLRIKLYGRDAWDGQLFATLWRFVFYRDHAPTLALTREQLVEHEAVLMLLAERRGAAVTPVVASGRAGGGDALLVVAHSGRTFADLDDTVADDVLDSAWDAVASVHHAGVAHARISPTALVLGDDGRALLTDFAGAQIALEPELLMMDEAQLLTTLAVTVGPERALASASRHLDPDRLSLISGYVQPAALPSPLRRAASAKKLDLDDLRDATVGLSGQTAPDLPKLRRLTLGTVLMGALLFFAFSALITNLTDIGIDTIIESFQQASLPLAILAFVIAQTPRFANAAALLAASPTPIPFARMSALQFATTFVNLAMPATAARVAVNIRFFRKAGVSATTATAIGAVDGVTGFLAQISLILTILLAGLGDIELNIADQIDTSKLVPLLIVCGIALVVVVLVFALVPKLRRGVLDKVRPALAPLTVLRSPRRAAKLFFFNVLAELLFSLVLYTVLLAFGQHVSFADCVLINESVALFAGLMPVPGGIGVTEAALTAGFVAAGVPQAEAFSAALVCRMCTYYLPPILGYPCFRWLQRSKYL